MKATVITDASFCHDTKSAGWAAWISPDMGERIKRYGTFKRKPAHSAQAELWAAINGITLAAKAGATDIYIQTDCLQVVELINGQTEKVYEALMLAKFEGRPSIKAAHVKGHTRHGAAKFWVNRWCDKHAGIAMREQRKSCINKT